MENTSKVDCSTQFQISIFEAILAWIAACTLLGLSLLYSGRFSGRATLIAGTGSVLLPFALRRWRLSFSWDRFTAVIFAILAGATFFRAPAYEWVMGGQDQGVYVNMSVAFEKYKSVFFQDPVRSRLKGEDLALYDQKQYYTPPNQQKFAVEDKYEGCFVPGLLIEDLAQSRLVWQFYHVHPLWMSLFASLFGSDLRYYSLLFFSLISIFALASVARELSGSENAGAVLAVFLALNPLHAFFTKFPTSELVSLGLSSSALLMLVRHLKEGRGVWTNNVRLILAVALMWCLFLNHISGFLFLPVLWGIALWANIFWQEKRCECRSLLTFAAAAFCGLVVSWVVGYKFSFPYFRDVFMGSFKPLLGDQWVVGTICLPVAALISLVPTPLLSRLEPVHKMRLFRSTTCAIAALFLLLIGYAFFQSWQVLFTDKFIDDELGARVFPVVHHGTAAFLGTTIGALIVYSGFFGFLVLIGAVAKKVYANSDEWGTGLLILLVSAWGIRVTMSPITYYHYYYARYLVGELIPYSALFVACCFVELSQARRKSWSWLVAGAIVTGLFISQFQLWGRESAGPVAAVKTIKKFVGPNDLIFLDGGIVQNSFRVPLDFFGDLNVRNLALSKARIDFLAAARDFKSLFILSEENLNNPGIEKVAELVWRRTLMEPKVGIPINFIEDLHVPVMLYRVTSAELFESSAWASRLINPRTVDTEGYFFDGWTDGHGKFMNLPETSVTSPKILIVHTRRHPIEPDPVRWGVRVFVNERIELKYSRRSDEQLVFEFPKGFSEPIAQLEIDSRTFIPSVEMNTNDGRSLGIWIKTLEFQ